VIVLSARPENAVKALSLGADDFLNKPFDVNELLKKIEAVLGDKK
jgi:DNA-binding response OmpR family regulator